MSGSEVRGVRGRREKGEGRRGRGAGRRDTFQTCSAVALFVL